MLVTILDIVIAGLLLGGLYAIIAMGLSLQYGVARVLNISHGEFIMLGAVSTWTLYTVLGINPLLSLVICGPIAFVLGFVLHRTLYKRLMVTSATVSLRFAFLPVIQSPILPRKARLPDSPTSAMVVVLYSEPVDKGRFPLLGVRG